MGAPKQKYTPDPRDWTDAQVAKKTICKIFRRDDVPFPYSNDEMIAEALRTGAAAFVYVVGHDDYQCVKIGLTTKPKPRLRALEALHCKRLELYALASFGHVELARTIETNVLMHVRQVWGRPHQRPPFSGREWSRASPRAAISAIKEQVNGQGMHWSQHFPDILKPQA